MKVKKKITACLCFILLFVLIYTILATSVFAASEPDNYAKPGVTAKATLDSADILSYVLGEELSDAERLYLKEYGEYSISYGSHIPTSLVEIKRESSGDFTVIADAYEYDAENGVRVRFLPATATVGDKEVAFSVRNVEGTEEYFADFEAADYAENQENGKARVTYKTELEIGEAVINSLLNQAYNDAMGWKEKQEQYDEAVILYEQNVALHAAYIEALARYENDLTLHEAYLVEKARYDRQKARYEEYEAEKQQYDDDLVLYQQYLADLEKYNEDYVAYQEYLKIKDDFDELYEKYQAYVRDMESVRHQIAILDGLKKTSTSQKRSVYSAVLIGTTVTEVLSSNKDLVANDAVGIAPEIVDLAGVATQNLRKIFLEDEKKYYELESEVDKYGFYCLNYEAIRSNFTDLFITLDKMYVNPNVRLGLKERGIQGKYEILLAQLYYIVLALNDEPVYNYDKALTYGPNYIINNITKSTPLSVLGNDPYMQDDNNATPLDGGYPAEVKEPILVENGEPQIPDYRAEPTPPEEVSPPEGDEPEPVERPVMTLDPVPEPEEPPYYEASPEVAALISAYDNGEIVERAQISGSRKIEIAVVVNKSLGEATDTYRVTFLDFDLETVLCEIEVESGSYAEYDGRIPQKAEDDRASYRFAGWESLDGAPFEIFNVTSDLVLYPVFNETVKTYTVGWFIDGELVQTRFEYGQMPVCPEIPVKEEDGTYVYTFNGWDKEITPVTGSVIYIADFSKEAIFLDQKGKPVAVQKVENGYYVDCQNKSDLTFDLTKLIPRVTPTEFITLQSQSCKITLSPEAIELMEEIGATGIELKTMALSGGGGYVISAHFLNADGRINTSDLEAESADVKIDIRKALDFGASENVTFYYLEGESRRPFRVSYESGILNTSCVVDREYYAIVEYPINLLKIEDVELSVNSDSMKAKSGDKIEVTVKSIPDGAIIDEIYYVTPDGKRTEITDGYFYMRNSIVSIGLSYHIPTYKATFVADEKTIYTVILKIGETVSAPPTPIKAADDEYSYVFVEWIPSLDAETGDVLYEARYMKIKLLPEEQSKGIEILPGIFVNISPSFLHTIAKIVLLAFYGGVVFLPLVTIIIIKNRRRTYR